MTNESRPLLTFGPAIVGERPKRPGRGRSNLVKPNPGRQATRIEPQFRKLVTAFEAQRAKMGVGIPDEVDPNLVIVFDLAGSVKDFCNAINRIEGLEFLSEFVGDVADSDDDFYLKDDKGNKTDKPVAHSLYLAMSNMTAIEELLQLFEKWKSDPKVKLDRGLSKFKEMFQQLVAIRHWGPQDRIQETIFYKEWKEQLQTIGNSQSFVQVEVELWYRKDKIRQIKAEEIVRNNVSNVAGKVISRALIPEINYHALLVELPRQQVELFLAKGAESVQLLTADEIMFVSPYRPMALGWQDNDSIVDDDLIRDIALNEGERVQGKPRVALLDGLPVSNHGALRGRLIIDDPDDLENHYPVIKRQHGTEMASLIIHGDLNEPDVPLDRPLYVRPIMESTEGTGCREQVISNVLFPDLLIRTVRRIIEGDGDSKAVAPSVRIINLSIGDPARVLIRRMSPGGRVLDWLAVNYNLLFIVSAGNHNEIPITIPVEDASATESARIAATQATFNNSLLLGILSPGDAINALTIGATHNDKADAIKVPDTVLDANRANFPAHYSGRGPGINRSIKPDLYYMGGRVVYKRPVITSEQQGNIDLEIADSSLVGPGVRAAVPSRGGAINGTKFCIGTSNAAALVTHEASKLFDILEEGNSENNLPDALYHPLLVRALLVHASSWGEWKKDLGKDLDLPKGQIRKQLTALLGYGCLDPNRLGFSARNRAVVITGGSITKDQRHTYSLPLPLSLRSKAEWHRFTVTLAFAAPTVGTLNQYRGSKVYFEFEENGLETVDRSEAEYYAARRGSLQHEIIEGTRAMTFVEGDAFSIHVECMDDAQHLRKKEEIKYALVASVETAEQTSTTIYDEVRMALRTQARDHIRGRVQG